MKLSPVKRVALAVVISPLAFLIIDPLVSSVGAWINDAEVSDMGDLFSRSPYGLYFLYPIMVVFGLPSYLVLSRLRGASIWVLAAVGFVGGAFSFQLLFFWPALLVFFRDGRVALLRELWGVPILWQFGVEGMLLAIVFWCIARPDLNSKATNRSAPGDLSQASAAKDEDVLNLL